MQVSKNFKDLLFKDLYSYTHTCIKVQRPQDCEMPNSESGHLYDIHFSQGSGIMWKRGQRLHKLETVDDYTDPVFYGHSREILHANSQQLWLHAQGLGELKPEQRSNSEVTGALGISVLGVKLLEADS